MTCGLAYVIFFLYFCSVKRNSGIFIALGVLLVLLFGATPQLADKIAAKGVIMYIITSVGINAVVEMLVAAVVTGAAGVALKKARLIR